MPKPVCPESTALFPDWDDRRRGEDRLTVMLHNALSHVAQGRAAPTKDADSIGRGLSQFDFRSAIPIEQLLDWTVEQLRNGIVQVTHPRYFGLFNPAPTFPSECADRIVAAFNPQLATSTTSPVAVAIERRLVQAVAQRAGLPDRSAGHFTSGGSEANFTALICALGHASPDFAVSGARAFAAPPVVYASSDSHLAWLKIAHQTGIGRSAVRLVPTDAGGRMDAQALRQALRDDMACGSRPVMVVATAGTTSAGMIDPLRACAQVAHEAGAWFHVDAAWGGALICSDRLRGCLDGIEAADSVTIDAHKWFATTMGCGMFLTRHENVLADTFRVETGYMPSNNPGLDPYVTSVQWSRRFLGLRLFLSLAAAGWDGYASHVEHAIALAEHLKAQLSARGWRIANESALAVVCAEPPDGYPAVRSIVRDVVASGHAWISTTTFGGRDVVRMCITNGRTMIEDVNLLVDTLQTFGRWPQHAGRDRQMHHQA